MLALPDELNPEPSLTRIGEALATTAGVPGASFGERGEHLEVK